MTDKLEGILMLGLLFTFIAFLFPTVYDKLTNANVTSGLQPFYNVTPLLLLVIFVGAVVIARRR